MYKCTMVINVEIYKSLFSDSIINIFHPLISALLTHLQYVK